MAWNNLWAQKLSPRKSTSTDQAGWDGGKNLKQLGPHGAIVTQSLMLCRNNEEIPKTQSLGQPMFYQGPPVAHHLSAPVIYSLAADLTHSSTGARR